MTPFLFFCTFAVGVGDGVTDGVAVGGTDGVVDHAVGLVGVVGVVLSTADTPQEAIRMAREPALLAEKDRCSPPSSARLSSSSISASALLKSKCNTVPVKSCRFGTLPHQF